MLRMRTEYIVAVLALLAVVGCTPDDGAIDIDPPCSQVKARPEKHTRSDAERCKDFHWEDTDRKKRY